MLVPVVLLVMVARLAAAQDLGGLQDPPGLRWRHLRTPRFEVIYPTALERDAQRAAAILEQVADPVSRSLQVKLKPTAVILRNQTVVANGSAGLGPRRSEWFSTPPQDPVLGTDEWYTLLATHEIRHLAQYDRLDRGFNHFAHQAFGDAGLAACSLVSAPLWFWEGDAVGVETALTGGGRGRRPAFDMEIRALLLGGRRYPYYKAFLRSYRDYYPNHYHLGYLLTTHVRRTRGPETWVKVLDRAARRSFNPMAFPRAVRRVTGLTVPQLYEEAMEEADSLWRQQSVGLWVTPSETLNAARRRAWTSYRSPQGIPSGEVVALKQGLADVATIVRLSGGGAEQEIGPVAPLDPISVAGDLVVWNQREPDPRWGYRDFAVLVARDLRTGRTRQLTHGSKLFAPALSPDGRRIAAVAMGPDRACSLVVVDAGAGQRLAAFASPGRAFLQTPAWSADASRLVCLRQDAAGTAVAAVELSTGAWRDLLPPTREALSHPVLRGPHLLYSSPVSGLDALWAVDLRDGQRYQVCSRPFGAFAPAVSPDGRYLLFEDYTADGYDAARIPLDPAAWVRAEDVPDRRSRYVEPLVEQEKPAPVLSVTAPPSLFPSSAYHPAAHALDVHSWYVAPFWPYLAFGVVSTDKLNTATALATFEYDALENAPTARLAGTYAGRWPVLDLDLRCGRQVSRSIDTGGDRRTDTWLEQSVRTGLRLPLDLSRGIHAAGLSVGASSEVSRISDAVRRVPGSRGNGTLVSLTWQARYARSRLAAVRDLYPRWGQGLAAMVRHTPNLGDFRGRLVSVQGEAFAPGAARHHGLRLQAGWEHQAPRNYRFARYSAFPRGYRPVAHRTLYRGALDYALPLAYPDWAAGGYLYVRRLQATLYGDGGVGRDPGRRSDYAAAGAELAAGFCAFTLPVQWTAGVRYAYRVPERDAVWEVVLFGVGGL